MRMIELELHPSASRLRQFGLAAAVVCGLLVVSAWWRGHVLFWDVGAAPGQVMAWLGIAAGVAILVAFLWPRGLWPLYVLLSLVAVPIGTVLSYTLLALFFYVLVTPVGLWFRLRRRDLLDRRGPGGRDSYWHPARGDRDAKSYFRQF